MTMLLRRDATADRAGPLTSPDRWDQNGVEAESRRIVRARLEADHMRSARQTAMTKLAGLRHDVLAFLRVAEEIEALDAQIDRIG